MNEISALHDRFFKASFGRITDLETGEPEPPDDSHPQGQNGSGGSRPKGAPTSSSQGRKRPHGRASCRFVV